MPSSLCVLQGWPGYADAEKEALLGAEMTRRTLTNACNIMERHMFVEHWARWREGKKG